MRSLCAMCAIVLFCSTGCFSSYLRSGDAPDGGSSDAAVAPRDIGAPARDAGSIPPTSCEAFWTSLPWCPAEPGAAVGTPCDHEGTRCGFACCEPGPPIECLDGLWHAVAFAPDCSAVDCAGPAPCGVSAPGEPTAACAYGRVCVLVDSGRGDSANPGRCVETPSPVGSCDAVPAGSIVDDPRGCQLCQCAIIEGAVQIGISCPCC